MHDLDQSSLFDNHPTIMIAPTCEPSHPFDRDLSDRDPTALNHCHLTRPSIAQLLDTSPNPCATTHIIQSLPHVHLFANWHAIEPHFRVVQGKNPHAPRDVAHTCSINAPFAGMHDRSLATSKSSSVNRASSMRCTSSTFGWSWNGLL